MGNSNLLQISDQRHTKAVRKIPNRVTTQASSWIGFIEFSQKFYLPFLGRVDAPLTVVRPSQKSGRAACPHPALHAANQLTNL